MLSKFGTKQVTLFLAGEITQVKESIPWVRCASGNVYKELFVWINAFREGHSQFETFTLIFWVSANLRIKKKSHAQNNFCADERFFWEGHNFIANFKHPLCYSGYPQMSMIHELFLQRNVLRMNVFWDGHIFIANLKHSL